MSPLETMEMIASGGHAKLAGGRTRDLSKLRE
jgi:hypothetical protein